MVQNIQKMSLIFLSFLTIGWTKTNDKIPFALLKKLVPENAVILEAGAQFGEDTAWMSELWPHGKIYSFEPCPEAYAQLREIAQKCRNVSVEQVALAHKVGVYKFFLAGGASSLLAPDYPFVHHNGVSTYLMEPIEVEVTTIDTWAESRGLDHIDFMWLDMEGNELNALQGAEKILKTVKIIHTEVNLQRFWHSGALYAEVQEWLEARGFEKIWDDVAPGWRGNAIFINKNMY